MTFILISKKHLCKHNNHCKVVGLWGTDCGHHNCTVFKLWHYSVTQQHSLCNAFCESKHSGQLCVMALSCGAIQIYIRGCRFINMSCCLQMLQRLNGLKEKLCIQYKAAVDNRLLMFIYEIIRDIRALNASVFKEQCV